MAETKIARRAKELIGAQMAHCLAGPNETEMEQQVHKVCELIARNVAIALARLEFEEKQLLEWQHDQADADLHAALGEQAREHAHEVSHWRSVAANARNEVARLTPSEQHDTERLEFREKVLALTDGHCIYCNMALALETLCVDHVIPRSAGGPDHLTNYVPACNGCNVLKGNRHRRRSRPTPAAAPSRSARQRRVLRGQRKRRKARWVEASAA